MLGFLSGKPTSAFITDGIIGTILYNDVVLNTVHQAPELLLHRRTRHRLQSNNELNRQASCKAKCVRVLADMACCDIYSNDVSIGQ